MTRYIPPDIIYSTLQFMQYPSTYSRISSDFRDIANMMDEETLFEISNIYHFWNRSLSLMKYQMNRAALNAGWDTILYMLRYIPFDKFSTEYIEIFSYTVEIARTFKVDNLISRIWSLSHLEIEDVSLPPLMYAIWQVYGKDESLRKRLEDHTYNVVMNNILPASNWHGYLHPDMRTYISVHIQAEVDDTNSLLVEKIHEDPFSFKYEFDGVDIILIDESQSILPVEVITNDMIAWITKRLIMSGGVIPISLLLEGESIHPVLIEHTYTLWDIHDVEDVLYDIDIDQSERLAIAYALGIPPSEDIIAVDIQ